MDGMASLIPSIPKLRLLTFLDGVDPIKEPWQHAKAGHHQNEECCYSGSSNGAQVPSSEVELSS